MYQNVLFSEIFFFLKELQRIEMWLFQYPLLFKFGLVSKQTGVIIVLGCWSVLMIWVQNSRMYKVQ